MQLSTDEPWDTMKAQILTKISISLNPPTIDFNDYNIMFHITHILPKPGLTLATELDFMIMNRRAHNMKAEDPTINLLVVEKKLVGEGKENEGQDDDQEKVKSNGKKVSICALIYSFT